MPVSDPIKRLDSSQRTKRRPRTYRDDLPKVPPLVSAVGLIVVRAVATANLPTTGTPTIDGITTWNPYDPILLTAQTDPEENGVWHWQSGTWLRSDNPTGRALLYTVTEGTSYANSLWQCTDLVWAGSPYPELTFQQLDISYV